MCLAHLECRMRNKDTGSFWLSDPTHPQQTPYVIPQGSWETGALVHWLGGVGRLETGYYNPILPKYL